MESPIELYRQLRNAHSDEEKAIIMHKIHTDLQSRGFVKSPDGTWVKPQEQARMGIGYDSNGQPVVKDRQTFRAFKEQHARKQEEARQRRQLQADADDSLIREAEKSLL